MPGGVDAPHQQLAAAGARRTSAAQTRHTTVQVGLGKFRYQADVRWAQFISWVCVHPTQRGSAPPCVWLVDSTCQRPVTNLPASWDQPLLLAA